ncbi:MAG TPA: hypothetical protein VH298_11345, partial [Jatrophihabitans sp.]|nr:hypothetical protein [Jatrophihabitans sp.]
RALAIALRDALESASVVHYPRPAAALAELLVGLATGRTERLWAWRQLDLVQAGDPDPVGVPAAAALAALRRRPAEAMPALISALPQAGLAALHRLFGPAGWIELARLVIAGLAGDPALAIPPERTDHPVARSAGLPVEPQPASESRLVAGITARSALHRAAVRSRLRPDRVTAWAWAALAVAEVEPALYSRPTVRATLARLSDGYQAVSNSLMSSSTTGRARSAAQSMPDLDGFTRAIPFGEQRAGGREPAASPDRLITSGLEQPATILQTSDIAGRPPQAASEPGRSARLGAEPEPTFTIETSWPTAWAGLPFFLATAGAASLPAALLDDEVLGGQPLSWLIYQLGRRLVPVIDPLDPALFALAGQLPAPVPPADPSPTESARLAEHADRWAELTAARLDRSDEPAASVAADLAGRPGRVSGQPGWIEIHLSLHEVRLDVRRAGLDLDPGWLRWLGAVVSFVYE